MFEFRTQFDRQRREASPGSPFHQAYRTEFDKRGDLVLVEDHVDYIPDLIDSHRESTDVNVILHRFQSGETDVLSRRNGTYGDFSDMPVSFADLLNTVNKGRQDFDALPLEIREKFGNSVEKYISMYGTSEWFDALGLAKPDSGVPSESEVKDGENNES